MSRIDTQSDRLGRVAQSLDQQRSFLVQPRSFQPAGPSLGGLAQALGMVSRTIRTTSDKTAAKRKEKTRRAEYNKLLEAKNRVNKYPSKYADEYIEMYQSVLDGLEDSDPFKTEVLRLDADGFVKSRIEAEETTLRGQITTSMRKMFVEIGNTYDSLPPDERLQYSTEPDTVRSTRLYNEYLDGIQENDQEVHDAILKYPQLEFLLRQEVDRRSAGFQQEHDTMLKAQSNIRFQNTVEGIVTEYETVGTWDEGQMDALATRNGIPVETVRNAVLENTLTSMSIDMKQGRLTLGDVSSRFQFLQEKAEEYGTNAEQLVYKAQGEFISLAMQDVLNTSESKMYEDIQSGLPLDEVIKNSDRYLLSTLSDVTGVDYSEDDSILTADAQIGIPNVLLTKLRDMHKAVQSEVESVQRERNARRDTTIGSTYDQLVEGSALNGIRRGDWNDLRPKYGGDTDIQTAFNAGVMDNVSVSSMFPNSDGHAKNILEAFVEGGPGERAWSIGAISAFKEPTFRHSIRNLNVEDRIGLMLVYDKLQGVDLDSVDLSDDTFVQDLRTEFARGETVANSISGVGTSKATNKFNKKVLERLGVKDTDNVSENLKLELELAKSQIDDLDLSDSDTAKALEMNMKTSGKTVFFDATKGLYDVFDDSSVVKNLPYSTGITREELLKDLDTSTGFISDSAYNLGKGVQAFGNTPGSSFLTHTPILGSVIADDLGISFDSNKDAMLEVAARVASTKVPNIQDMDTADDEVILEAYRKLFRNDSEQESFLRLDIGTDNGEAYIVAVGFINGHPYTGDDAILITKWNPEWNNVVGKSYESIQRAEKFEAAAVNTTLYFTNPNTLGGKAVRLVGEVIGAQEEAYKANPSAFKVRP